MMNFNLNKKTHSVVSHVNRISSHNAHHRKMIDLIYYFFSL